MGKPITIKSGNSTVILPDNLMNTFNNVLDKLLPETKQQLNQIVEEIAESARDDWPVRRRKDGSINPASKNSRGKIYSEVVVTTDFEIVARVGCDAEYAFAIKVGARTRIDLPLGRRVANELLWKPTKKKTNLVIGTLANDTIKLMKK